MEKKEARRIFLLALFGFFLVVLFISLVSASYSFGESFDSLFSDWGEGDVAPNVAKIIFAVLLLFLIYALLENTKIIENKGAIWVISTLVSFLATMYIAPEEIYALLVSYSALGLTLGAILPFLILAGFTFSAIRSGNPTQMILQWIAWAGFGAFMIYRAVIFFVDKEGNFGVSLFTGGSFVVWILLAMTLGAVLMVFFNNQIIHFFMEKYIQAEKKAGRLTARRATTMMNTLADMQKRTAGGK